SFLHAYWISGLIAVVTVGITIALGGPLAYRIARQRGRRYAALLGIFVVGTFVPSQVILIPVVFLLRAIGLQDSLVGLFLYMSALSLPMTVFLYTGYIRSVPCELDEAAMVDGAVSCGPSGRSSSRRSGRRRPPS
ncbi:binding-protein-dependent transport system inner membrane component, partial [mine drainage metagenome]